MDVYNSKRSAGDLSFEGYSSLPGTRSEGRRKASVTRETKLRQFRLLDKNN